MFASAGADRRINVMNIDQDEPLKVYEWVVSRHSRLLVI